MSPAPPACNLPPCPLHIPTAALAFDQSHTRIRHGIRPQVDFDEFERFLAAALPASASAAPASPVHSRRPAQDASLGQAYPIGRPELGQAYPIGRHKTDVKSTTRSPSPARQKPRRTNSLPLRSATGYQAGAAAMQAPEC